MGISSNPLPSETGRFKKIPRDERICPFCETSIGDEFCCFYEVQPPITYSSREVFLERRFSINDNFRVFTYKALFKYVFSHGNIINLCLLYYIRLFEMLH